jgi:hypothetical protein
MEKILSNCQIYETSECLIKAICSSYGLAWFRWFPNTRPLHGSWWPTCITTWSMAIQWWTEGGILASYGYPYIPKKKRRNHGESSHVWDLYTYIEIHTYIHLICAWFDKFEDLQADSSKEISFHSCDDATRLYWNRNQSVWVWAMWLLTPPSFASQPNRRTPMSKSSVSPTVRFPAKERLHPVHFGGSGGDRTTGPRRNSVEERWKLRTFSSWIPIFSW